MKHFTKKYIRYKLVLNIFISLGLGIFVIAQFLDASESDEIPPIVLLLALIACVGGYALLSLYTVLYYLKSGYKLTETQIICKRGVIFKRKSIVDYDKMHTIHKNQNLFQQLFGLATLSVDSGSTTNAGLAEISIIETKEEVEQLLKKLQSIQKSSKQEGEITESLDIKPETIYEYQTKGKIVSALVNTLGIAFIGLFVVLFLILFIKVMWSIEPDPETTFSEVMLIIISTSLSTLFFLFLAMILRMFIGYYNFKIQKAGEELSIGYGLINKTNNVIQLRRIKGVRIKEGIIQRIFGLATVYVEVIGYHGENNDGKAQATLGVLIPLCKRAKVDEYLEKIDAKYLSLPKQESPKFFFPFISYPLLIYTCILAFVLAYLGYFSYHYSDDRIMLFGGLTALGFFLILLIVLFISNGLAYNNNGIAIASDKITIYSGNFTKETLTILQNNIIGVD